MAIFDLSALSGKEKENPQTVHMKENVNNVVNNNVENSDGKKNQQDFKDTVKHINLDGPLSYIYTKALNVAFAKENMVEFSLLYGNNEDSEDQNRNMNGRDLYVYCCEPDKMTDYELAQLPNKLRVALDSGCKKVMVAAECDKVTRNVVSIEEIARRVGVHLFFKRTNALDNVKLAVESL